MRHGARDTSGDHSVLLPLLVSALFFFSGMFALVYELSWVRALTLQFGSTTLAVSTVLTMFMGGLAFGAAISGRRSDRITTPLTVYGVIECALAFYAVLTPALFRWVLPVFGWFGSTITSEFWAVSLLRFVVAGVLLLPPTALMGATLPVLSRLHIVRRGAAGRGAGLLYGVNTLGGFVGTLMAGFLLLPTIGLTNTIVVAAAGNLVLGGIALLVGRRTEGDGTLRSDVDSTATMETGGSWLGPLPSLTVAVALTGAAAMVCEVAWTRLLALVLGGSVYAFTVVLATFLAGLGLGATAVAGLLRFPLFTGRRLFYGLAVLTTLTTYLSLTTFQYLPGFFRDLYWAWDLRAHPEQMSQVQFLVAGIVMLVPAFLMGGLLPAAIGSAVRHRDHTGRRVGTLYASNVVGTVLGSSAAGFALIPLLGIQNTVVVAAALQCTAAVVLALAWKRRGPALALAGAALCVFLSVAWSTPEWNPQLMTSAMYRYSSAHPNAAGISLEYALDMQEELLFYRDGLTATVTVGQDRLGREHHRTISTNGKRDGSSGYDMPTQRLSAHVPLVVHPAPQNVCVIGMGTGCTAGSAALHDSVRNVTVVEIEEALQERPLGATGGVATNEPSHRDDPPQHVVPDHVFDEEADEVGDLDVDTSSLAARLVDGWVEHRDHDYAGTGRVTALYIARRCVPEGTGISRK